LLNRGSQVMKQGMKVRGLILIFVFGAGVAVGFFAAQKNIQQQVHKSIMTTGSFVEEQIGYVVAKVQGKSIDRREDLSAGRGGVLKTQSAPQPVVDKGDYIRNHVTVSELQARRDPASASTAIVSGKLMQTGSRPLAKADLNVFFMGKEDIVFDVKLPILSGAALEPNGSKEFFWRVERVPAEWTGRIRGSITDISF
jgi:hypothetical protein